MTRGRNGNDRIPNRARGNIQLQIRHGAKPDDKDGNGKTARERASQERLRRHGPELNEQCFKA